MQDRKAGQAPIQGDMDHREGDQLVELLVQRAVAVELDRQHGRDQPLVPGRGRVIFAEQPLEGDRVGDAGGQHQPRRRQWKLSSRGSVRTVRLGRSPCEVDGGEGRRDTSLLFHRSEQERAAAPQGQGDLLAVNNP